MSSELGVVARAIAFVAERVPVEKMSFRDLVTKKEVPLHRMSWGYYLGGLSLFYFMLQMLTGLALLFYYQPSVSDAHASVEYITQHVAGGAFIRNLHTWSASFMIFCVLAHFLTTLAMKAFARPRELTWLTGAAMLLLTFGFGFTGYLLPWNQIAVNATKVGLQSIELPGQYLPGALATLPTQMREIIQGEASVGQATLSRFFALHVVVLPLLTLTLLGGHLFMVQLHGMSQGVDEKPRATERFFPFFLLKDLSLWGGAFLVVAVLALCLPFESFFAFPLFEPYDALGSTPEGIKPEWYFYFAYYPLEILPFWLVSLGMGAGVAGLFAAPWALKRTGRRVMRIVAMGIGGYLFTITLFGDLIYRVIKGGP
jgi:cytochrome b6